MKCLNTVIRNYKSVEIMVWVACIFIVQYVVSRNDVFVLYDTPSRSNERKIELNYMSIFLSMRMMALKILRIAQTESRTIARGFIVSDMLFSIIGAA